MTRTLAHDANSTACYWHISLCMITLYTVIRSHFKVELHSPKLLNVKLWKISLLRARPVSIVFSVFSTGCALAAHAGSADLLNRVMEKNKGRRVATPAQCPAGCYLPPSNQTWPMIAVPATTSYAAWKQLDYSAVGKASNLLGVDKQTLKSFTNDVPNLCGICSLQGENVFLSRGCSCDEIAAFTQQGRQTGAFCQASFPGHGFGCSRQGTRMLRARTPVQCWPVMRLLWCEVEIWDWPPLHRYEDVFSAFLLRGW